MNLILEMILSEDIKKLLNNKEDMDNLYHAKTIENVLDVLKRYGYKGNSEDLDRDIFEISEVSDCELDKAVGGKRRLTPIVLASALALTSIGFEPSVKADVSVLKNVGSSVKNTFEEKITKAFKSAKEKIVKPDKENILSGGIGATLATLFTSLVFGKKVLSKNNTIKNLEKTLSEKTDENLGLKKNLNEANTNNKRLADDLKEVQDTTEKLKKDYENDLEEANKKNKELQTRLDEAHHELTNPEPQGYRRVKRDENGVPAGWDDWYEKRKKERDNEIKEPEKFAPEFLDKFKDVKYQSKQETISEIPQGIVAKRVDLLNARPYGRQIPTAMYFNLQPFEYFSVYPEPNGNYGETRSTPFSNLETSQESVEEDLYTRFVDRPTFNADEEKYLAEIEEALTEFVSSEEWTHIKADFYQMIDSMPDRPPDTEEKTFTEPYLLQLQYWLLKFTSLSSYAENYRNVYRLYFGYGTKPYAALSSILDILHSLSYNNITYYNQIDARLKKLNKSLNYLRTNLATSENFDKINEFFDLVESAGKWLEFLSNY